MDVEGVLRDMDRCSNNATSEPFDRVTPAMVSRWLAVLREHHSRCMLDTPGAGNWMNPASRPPDPNVERFPLKSGLPQRLLRDLELVTTFRADHEGTGEVEFNYARVPQEHRLQALLSVMGCLSDRIELAMGTEAYVNLLRGVIARRER
jgi:hypothetical protein